MSSICSVDGQDFDSWRHYRLRERTSWQDQQFATREQTRLEAVEFVGSSQEFFKQIQYFVPFLSFL